MARNEEKKIAASVIDFSKDFILFIVSHARIGFPWIAIPSYFSVERRRGRRKFEEDVSRLYFESPIKAQRV